MHNFFQLQNLDFKSIFIFFLEQNLCTEHTGNVVFKFDSQHRTQLSVVSVQL